MRAFVLTDGLEPGPRSRSDGGGYFVGSPDDIRPGEAKHRPAQAERADSGESGLAGTHRANRAPQSHRPRSPAARRRMRRRPWPRSDPLTTLRAGRTGPDSPWRPSSLRNLTSKRLSSSPPRRKRASSAIRVIPLPFRPGRAISERRRSTAEERNNRLLMPRPIAASTASSPSTSPRSTTVRIGDVIHQPCLMSVCSSIRSRILWTTAGLYRRTRRG